MVRTKVFVGNLSFTTKENELAKEFEVAGKVISANIITRGPRSLGYGFVEMDSEGDAQNAVKLLDKKEIDGRPINVEVAKPREEGADLAQAANAQGQASTRGSSRGGRGGARGSSRGAPRGGAPNGRGGFSGNQQRQPQSQQGQGQGQQQRRDDTRPPRPRQQDDAQPRRAPRPPRSEGDDNRTPSATTLFVANLPFSLDDAGFEKFLKDLKLTHKTAHVVTKRTGRSKGFGFIEFDNQADQQKALSGLSDKEIEGRALAVKVALTEIRTDDAQSSSSPAPSKNASPAPAKASSPAPSKAATPAQTTEKKEEKPATPKTDKK